MLLGSSSFAGLPFASITNNNGVTITPTKIQVTLGIGNIGITADSITELPHASQVVLGLGTVTVVADANVTAVKNQVVISSGTVTITADANVEPTGGTLTLSTGTAQAITWSEIGPGVSMVWVPIVPY